MKKVFLSLLIGGIFPATFAQQPVSRQGVKLEALYQKHLTALGGMAKLKALNTYRYTITNANDFSFTLCYKSPGYFNKTFSSDKGTVTDIIRGTENWSKSLDGTVEKGTFAAGVITDIITNSIQGFLIEAKRLKFTISLLPSADAADRIRVGKSIYHKQLNDSCMVVKVVPTTKGVTNLDLYIFIDPVTYLITAIQENNMIGTDWYVFSDYIKVDGMQVFSSVGWGMEGNLTSKNSVNNIELNPVLDDKLFAVPVTKR